MRRHDTWGQVRVSVDVLVPCDACMFPLACRYGVATGSKYTYPCKYLCCVVAPFWWCDKTTEVLKSNQRIWHQDRSCTFHCSYYVFAVDLLTNFVPCNRCCRVVTSVLLLPPAAFRSNFSPAHSYSEIVPGVRSCSFRPGFRRMCGVRMDQATSQVFDHAALAWATMLREHPVIPARKKKEHPIFDPGRSKQQIDTNRLARPVYGVRRRLPRLQKFQSAPPPQ